MKKINLNDLVKVRLTEEGIKVYREYYKQNGWLMFPEVDRDGFTTMQLHAFAGIYGKYMIGGIDDVLSDADIYTDEQ